MADDQVPGWGDDRLHAAFASVAGQVAPEGLAAVIVARLDAEPPRRRWRLPALGWRMASVLVAVLIVAVGIASWSIPSHGPPSTGSSFVVRPGPGGLSTFDAGQFRFDFPSAWSVSDSSAAFSGGSSLAVLGTMPIEARCGTAHVDINCVYRQSLDPGTIRVVVGSAAFRGTTIFDRPDLEAGSTTRLTIAGMPAILDDNPAPGGYYHADLDLSWYIGYPDDVSNAISIEVQARDPGAVDARAAAEALIASFAFTPPVATLPPGSGPHLARLAIAEMDRSFRQGFGQTAGQNHYSCQPDTPDTTAETTIRFSAGGDLGGEVPVTCSWTMTGDGQAYLRVELHVDWTAGGRTGRYTERIWIGADGSLAGSAWSGEGPPAVAAPSPTEPPPSPSPGMTAFGLPVIGVEDALARFAAGPARDEIAVRGWFAAPVIRQLCRPETGSEPVLTPRCGEDLIVLMRDPERLIGSNVNPLGPALKLMIREAGMDLAQPYPMPVDVIVVGHFDDPRATSCPPADVDACRSTFVADRILPAGASPSPVVPGPWLASGMAETAPPRDPSAVLAYLRPIAGGLMPLSIGMVDASHLSVTLPAASGVTGWPADGIVWVVRVLGTGDRSEPPQLRVLVIPDAWIAGDLAKVVDMSGAGAVVLPVPPTTDAVTALDLATRFETARATGQWAAAWALLSPQSQATIGSLETFTTEETAYNAAGAAFSIQPPTRDPEALANVLGASEAGIAAVADESRGYLVFVAHPDYPAASASSEGLFIAPLRSGEWRVWIVH